MMCVTRDVGNGSARVRRKTFRHIDDGFGNESRPVRAAATEVINGSFKMKLLKGKVGCYFASVEVANLAGFPS